MRESSKSNSKESHKEEGKARIVVDKQDRMSLEKKIDLCIHPFIPDQHPSNIVNIVTGRLSSPSVSVQNVVSIGTSQMRVFENSWPDEFHSAIQKKVITMAATKKSVQLRQTKVYDTNLISSHVMGCVAPAVPSKLGWIPRHCWKNGVKPPLFLFVSFVLSATPQTGGNGQGI